MTLTVIPLNALTSVIDSFRQSEDARARNLPHDEYRRDEDGHPMDRNSRVFFQRFIALDVHGAATGGRQDTVSAGTGG